MMDLEFMKMHGLGNDFVVLDARARPLAIGADQARAIANRRTGIGCDQVLVLEPAPDKGADAFMRIYNSDGSDSAACGNGARCVAAFLMDEAGTDVLQLETVAGVLDCRRAPNGEATVDMGPAYTDWREVPLARETDTLHLGIGAGDLSDPVAVSVGNPHAVFFVDDVAAIPLEIVGPRLEHHDMFPERANIEAVQHLGGDRVRMRVWERGSGITQACGSGACAVAVAAHRRGLTGRTVEVVLDGGTLVIEWTEDNRVLMTGPVARSFDGTVDPSLLAAAA